MTYVIQQNSTGWTPIASIDTAQRHPLGTRVQATDPLLGAGEFIYMKGVASNLLGAWSTLNLDDGTTTLIVADAIGSVGVSMAVIDAATKFGWYQIYGKASALAAASFADNGAVYIASSGVVDDAVVDGDMVHNAKGASTIVAAGLAEFEIHYPYTDNINSND